jgi:hypothetical protein
VELPGGSALDIGYARVISFSCTSNGIGSLILSDPKRWHLGKKTYPTGCSAEASLILVTH